MLAGIIEEHQPQMRVQKRSGHFEKVDVSKVVRAVEKHCDGLHHVDPSRIAIHAISGLHDGVETREIDQLAIRTAASLLYEEPEYDQLATRLLSGYIQKELSVHGISSFSKSIESSFERGMINNRVYSTVRKYHRELDLAIDHSRDRNLDYFGIARLFTKRLLTDPHTKDLMESPQYLWMRIAVALGEDLDQTLALYRLFSSLAYLPSSPTMLNAGLKYEQMSSCYLLDSPQDDLSSILNQVVKFGLLSKHMGGVGMAFHRVRSKGSSIKKTNGISSGIVPALKHLDSAVAYVNQSGKRKGACCVYLEPWHADIEQFLELRDNTGDENQRTYNLNLANWIPDIFMQRVERNQDWSLFDPKVVPHFPDLYGEDFELAYVRAEREGLAKKTIPARDLYSRMMKTLAQTGNGWMTFKDHSNKKANQTFLKENVIHLSNLCTEILEVTSDRETAVCNLGSINLALHVKKGQVDYAMLAETVRSAVRQLDNVIDLNYYPEGVPCSRNSNMRWRPIGLGLMGFQDVLFKLRVPFESQEAERLSREIQECVYYHALKTSLSLAKLKGAHTSFNQTWAGQGVLQFDQWGVVPSSQYDWDELKREIKNHGLRNSLLIAIAPTATIASIAGCYECIEPQVSNLFKRETDSGEFLQLNKYLVEDLRKLGLWNDSIRQQIKEENGSIQKIADIPLSIRNLYKTVWEISQKSLINVAAARAPFIDQSQSLNLFIENPSIGKLSSMYMYAWKKGIKTTYYLRSRPATRIAQIKAKSYTEQEAVACSLENPELCEACQ